MADERFLLRDVRAEDHPALLALNAASVAVLSPMDATRLRTLLAQCALCRVVEEAGAVRAFVLALREGAPYGSVNYRWFDARYSRFLYVDRVVVDARTRGAGLGQRLYADVFDRARCDDVPCVTCEFDLIPPNPASERFHARQGFVEVGRQTLPGGKQVSLQVADVAAQSMR
ncbi:GNAT family N-acetyltransferase [Lysobacter sp. TY2-98]|uniref:GNAT family N-acetyltransferase n=1 Tax=Lysobacter sp. TY2-98 TaxID=2290922 RepID=UPI000E2015FF|nr:GNAT family N-acetyltransferase [Lysobacter sp. TY2-98]AXK72468.1 GNAT family N-acetyltransferase [Lysobacter sp. TY2-98]